METGQLTPMSSDYAARWDPVDPKEGGHPPGADFGWIGEDADGVFLRLHPVTALVQHPELWDVYDEVRYLPEVQPDDVHRLSAFEFDCKVAFVAARQRKERRDLKERPRE